MTAAADVRDVLLDRLTDEQRAAVVSPKRRLLVVAGAGSGKTEVMARRIAWWIAVDGVPRDQIIAFTFTEKAAEEMKFRIRKWVGKITPGGEDATLGRMYIGTIHGFCLQMLQELDPETYGMFDVLDDTGRLALVQKWYDFVLGLPGLQSALSAGAPNRKGRFATIADFLRGYDLLHEFDQFAATGPDTPRPEIGSAEADWIKAWSLDSDVGSEDASSAFALSAARYYGALHARRLLDFSTSQSELVKLLDGPSGFLHELRHRYTHLVVDEFQDVNPVQARLVELITGVDGSFTAVGDHRQAIYGFRGGRVQIMGSLHNELDATDDGQTLTLPHNFRSTDRVIDLANAWARSITPPGGMASPAMVKGNEARVDQDDSHIALRRFPDRDAEAEWIARTVCSLVDSPTRHGVPHDIEDSLHRGIGMSDIAVLTRTSTDARRYMEALERAGVPAIVRAGPDLFRRPEVLVLLCALCRATGIDSFFDGRPPSMATIAKDDLRCAAEPVPMLRAAAQQLVAAGLPVVPGDIDRLVIAADEVGKRLAGDLVDDTAVRSLQTPELRQWLRSRNQLRRIFPQTIFQWLAAEFGVARWDAATTSRATTAMFHVGQLAGLITGIETPGWVRPQDLRWQMIALTNWGAQNARSEEAPLLVPPDAVSILTIHSAKGLEFPVVFLADVAARRFPSQRAKTVSQLPFAGPAARAIDAASLADNGNYDGERRLMYVGLTRAERYLFISSGSAQKSAFEKELDAYVQAAGGEAYPVADPLLPALAATVSNPAFRLVTSFSDLRYFLECPHDYYLRKVLGFAPTIDQAFGYGRGVHNLMRDVHLRPSEFAGLAGMPAELLAEVQRRIEAGLFYLRYTTGEPLSNMKKRAKEIVAEYVQFYRDELGTLDFEPERAFETLLEEADVLVSGAIDVIRHDDPPRVSLIDFKSGAPGQEDDNASALDKEQMQLQISLYGLAAKKELEYEPDLGLVRYLGVRPGATEDERELKVPLGQDALDEAKSIVVATAHAIQDRQWASGPTRGPKRPGNTSRCEECDFVHLCGRPEARAVRRA